MPMLKAVTRGVVKGVRRGVVRHLTSAISSYVFMNDQVFKTMNGETLIFNL